MFLVAKLQHAELCWTTHKNRTWTRHLHFLLQAFSAPFSFIGHEIHFLARRKAFFHHQQPLANGMHFKLLLWSVLEVCFFCCCWLFGVFLVINLKMWKRYFDIVECLLMFLVAVVIVVLGFIEYLWIDNAIWKRLGNKNISWFVWDPTLHDDWGYGRLGVWLECLLKF